MRIIRMMLPALIAIAVAVAPATGRTIVSVIPFEVSMQAQGDMPCCPSGEEREQLKSIACALQCMTLVGAIPAAAAVPQPCHIAEVPRSFVTAALHGHIASPPTHPPPA
jgi:hypothetical protein